MFALGSALLLALFVTWLAEYLGIPDPPDQTTPLFSVRILAGEQASVLGLSSTTEQLAHPQAASAFLESSPATATPAPRELAGTEVAALLGAMEPASAGYAALLLRGFSPYELPVLHSACFELPNQTIAVPGAGGGSFTVGPCVLRRLDPLLAALADARPLPVAVINARLCQAAQQARLADSQAITALALWYIYIAYLIRQGIDVATLTRRVGIVPPSVLDALTATASAGGKRSEDSIDFTYPALVF